jgi:hypothetical protein
MHWVMSRPRFSPWVGLWVGLCSIGLACKPDAPTPAETQAPPSAEEAGPTEIDSADEADADADAGEPTPEVAAEADAGEVEPDLVDPSASLPQAPPGYGVFVFPIEPLADEQLTLHGAAGYEVVAVYAKPDMDSARLGFLRIGTRVRAGERVVNEDCHKGWYPIEGGGFACASKGLMVDQRPPFMSYEPAAARMDQPFPYDWAYVRQWNTPMWWQVPNTEQLVATREKRAVRELERLRLEAELRGDPPPPTPGTPDADADAGTGDDDGGAGLPAPDDEDSGGGDGGEPPTPEQVDPSGDSGDGGNPIPEPEEEKEPVSIPLSPTPWLEKGYYLSLGETIRDGSRSYWRTARGGVVEKGSAHSVDPKDFHGAELTESMSFPVGFVMVKNGTKLLQLGADDKLHATGKNLEKRTFLDLGEEVEIGGQTYFSVNPYPPPDAVEAGETGEDAAAPAPADDSLFVKADVIRSPDLQVMPKGLEPWDRWIDVDITKQMLVAYEGSRPVYVTLVSTGKKGTDEEPFETPTGRFRIRSKQVTSNMDGTTATDGNYAIQDVPWVMYFEGSYALHGAFWHQSFGSVRSHGCVNLGPTDARWLFLWTTPFVPERWHGVTASDDNPGTTIVIRRSEAR